MNAPVYTKKHDEERHHPKTENFLYQYQSHRAYHKFQKKQMHLQQKSVNLKGGLRYLRYWLCLLVVQVDKFDHTFKIRVVNVPKDHRGTWRSN